MVASGLREKYRQNFNFLAAAQNFEYKMLNILNIPLAILISFLATDFFRVLIRFPIFSSSRDLVYMSLYSIAK